MLITLGVNHIYICQELKQTGGSKNFFEQASKDFDSLNLEILCFIIIF